MHMHSSRHSLAFVEGAARQVYGRPSDNGLTVPFAFEAGTVVTGEGSLAMKVTLEKFAFVTGATVGAGQDPLCWPAVFPLALVSNDSVYYCGSLTMRLSPLHSPV